MNMVTGTGIGKRQTDEFGLEFTLVNNRQTHCGKYNSSDRRQLPAWERSMVMCGGTYVV